MAGTISNCYSTGSVTGDTQVGGVVGQNTTDSLVPAGKVSNCYSTGDVTSSSAFSGGVAGLNQGTVENCVALNQSVSGTTSYVGRVVGQNSSGTLANNYANDAMMNGSTILTSSNNATDKNGADVTLDATEDETWWSTSAGVDWSDVWGGTAADEAKPWQWNGKDSRPMLWFE